MKRGFLLIAVLIYSVGTFSQGYKKLNIKSWTESDKNDSVYTVAGYRHGVSFFPQVKHSEVEYEIGDNLNFEKFHSCEVINGWLIRWAAEYPDTELYRHDETSQ